MAQTAKTAIANIAPSTTDAVIVAADSSTTNRSIKVVSVAMVAGATATNATFNTMGTGAGTAISCLFANGANGGAVLNRNEDGWFCTIAGQALTCTTGSGSNLGVLVSYIYV